MMLVIVGEVAGSCQFSRKRREIAVRVALGATRARIFTHLFAENLILTAASVFAAWGVSSLTTSALSRFFPALARDTWFDPRSLVALATFTFGAGVVAGTVPALQAARAHTTGLCRSSGAG